MTEDSSNDSLPTVLVVDDEHLARLRMQKLVEDIDGYDCIGLAENGDQALAMIESLSPDIVLLDIRMPGKDGMDVAESIAASATKYETAVIFTTAYEEHALEAFEKLAAGYLLKPVNREKLQKSLEQASRLVGSKPRTHTRNHLSASSRGKVELIPLEDVRVLQAEHKYVTVHHKGGESILDESLKTLEDEFPDMFKRVHRNALVAVDHVQGLEKNSEGQYVLKMEDTDMQPVVSRRLVSTVRSWIKKL